MAKRRHEFDVLKKGAAFVTSMESRASTGSSVNAHIAARVSQVRYSLLGWSARKEWMETKGLVVQSVFLISK